jgi:hypothetical protein
VSKQRERERTPEAHYCTDEEKGNTEKVLTIAVFSGIQRIIRCVIDVHVQKQEELFIVSKIRR